MKDYDEFICEMEYKDSIPVISARSKTLARGVYMGFEYTVINIRGSHPCGYVNVDGHVDELRDSRDEWDYGFDWVECHGGVTFTGRLLSISNVPAHIADEEKYSHGWWIGWDYAHCDDYTPYLPGVFNSGRKYTTAEVVYDCKHVIRQIVKKLNGK